MQASLKHMIPQQYGRILAMSSVEGKVGKPAIVEMIGWKAGNFEVLPMGLPRPRTIFIQYESLLMETAQTLDEADEANSAQATTPESLLSAFSRFTADS